MQPHRFAGWRSLWRAAVILTLLALLVGLAAPPQAMAAPSGPAAVGKLAYVYRGNKDDAATFFNLLTDEGYTVTLVDLADVLTTNFNDFDLTLIANDTGNLNVWGTDPAQVVQLTAPNKPILGLGEGGYAFFGTLSLRIGWPWGWHGSQLATNRADGAPSSYYTSPYTIGADPVQSYARAVGEVGIYSGASGLPADTIAVGVEPASSDHAPLIFQGCRQLWGFAGNPGVMTAEGKHLFFNAVQHAKTLQCATKPPPDPKCLTVVKEAVPASGTSVLPGEIITYTITYSESCQRDLDRLVDTVPAGTTFVPGSASDGASPGPDGVLSWAAALPGGTKSFKVRVDESACRLGVIRNHATLTTPSTTPLDSAEVTHKATCPPVGFPNDQPSYAESEIQVNPYPLITGHPSHITARVTNNLATPQVLTVSFQTSADRFGIGLNFTSFDTQVVTVPGNSSVIVATDFTPVSSGHYCIQVKVVGSSGLPVYTQQNLDVTEDLKPGVTDTLTFKVGNPTAATADINLVVVNTCPGWTAVVQPAVLSAVGPNDNDIRSASLLVTPPDPAILGTACHIDVQGWIGNQMIGGIRKLDVPPVHLPPNVQPPWEEPEISLSPDPPIVGQPAQICVQLQNPLGFARPVTVDFRVADFGAGVPFTSVGSQGFTLPANSLANYCHPWTPAAGGTLHRCILIVLSQVGYQDQTSQRNLDLVQAQRAQPDLARVPFVVGNPDGVQHHLTFQLQTFGIDPYWQAVIRTNQGDPPPDVIMGDGSVRLFLQLQPANTAQSSQAAPVDYQFGAQSQVEVTALLDGVPVGGMTVQLLPPALYLPLVHR